MNKRNTIMLFLVIIFLICGMSQNLLSQVPEQDSLALVALYDSTNGASWTTRTNWLEGSVSNWFGITVVDGRVTEISLASNNLSGTLPPQIGDLTNLSLLYLSQNQLTGEIPTEIENLGFLKTLNLRFNELSGLIPPGIYNLTTLVTINLSVNQLEGTIPPEIENLVNLSEYSVPVNNMHGTIPTELGNLVNLRYLWLNGNSFEGSVPNGVGNMSQLLYLRIDNNQFTDLPDISADSVLYETQIQNNRFTFEDIEPNISAGGFIYSPQDSIGDKQDVTIPQDSSHVLSVSVDGTANKYQWKKDGIVIEEATDSSYIIVGATSDDEGSYVCDISNTIATELTLYSRAINVTVSGATGIESQSTQILKIFSLNQNYPNPFNPKTIINYELPITDVIDLSIFNILGKKVATIVSKKQSAGSYRVSWDASGFSSGVYYYKLTTSSGFTQSHKMVFLK